MTKESYADFSIVQRYIDQKKIFDVELDQYKQQIETLEQKVRELQEACARRDKVILQLKAYKAKVSELEEKFRMAHQKVNDKEAIIRQLNARVRALAAGQNPSPR
jgi:septal ring factor EnvC (AmiA/AmiB activator)